MATARRSPISPSVTMSCAALTKGLCRRWCPTSTLVLVASASSAMRRAGLSGVGDGFFDERVDSAKGAGLEGLDVSGTLGG